MNDFLNPGYRQSTSHASGINKDGGKGAKAQETASAAQEQTTMPSVDHRNPNDILNAMGIHGKASAQITFSGIERMMDSFISPEEFDRQHGALMNAVKAEFGGSADRASQVASDMWLRMNQGEPVITA